MPTALPTQQTCFKTQMRGLDGGIQGLQAKFAPGALRSWKKIEAPSTPWTLRALRERSGTPKFTCERPYFLENWFTLTNTLALAAAKSKLINTRKPSPRCSLQKKSHTTLSPSLNLPILLVGTKKKGEYTILCQFGNGDSVVFWCFGKHFVHVLTTFLGCNVSTSNIHDCWRPTWREYNWRVRIKANDGIFVEAAWINIHCCGRELTDDNFWSPTAHLARW